MSTDRYLIRYIRSDVVNHYPVGLWYVQDISRLVGRSGVYSSTRHPEEATSFTSDEVDALLPAACWPGAVSVPVEDAEQLPDPRD